jgi:hypothetical protein
LGPIPHLNPLITPSTEMWHREPMTINAFASSFNSPSHALTLSHPTPTLPLPSEVKPTKYFDTLGRVLNLISEMFFIFFILLEKFWAEWQMMLAPLKVGPSRCHLEFLSS